MTPTYVLEVVKFLTEADGEKGWKAQGGKFEHVGYMKAKFKTKDDAVSYYDRHNPRMRSLNAHNNYRSDWDPVTTMLYIVREDCDIIANIEPFSANDRPMDEGMEEGVARGSKRRTICCWDSASCLEREVISVS